MAAEMTFTTHSPEETERLGQALGSVLQSGDVVLLSGNLGSGKTTFTKGVAAGLDILEEVTSPTFVLVAEYEGRVPLVHMDLYRLADATLVKPEPETVEMQGEADKVEIDGASQGGIVVAENSLSLKGNSLSLEGALAGLGFDDYLEGDGVLLIEWPQNLAERLVDVLEIQIQPAPLPRLDERSFHCRATSNRSWKLLDEWVKQWLF